jgi:hypothetical protein
MDVEKVESFQEKIDSTLVSAPSLPNAITEPPQEYRVYKWRWAGLVGLVSSSIPRFRRR